MDTIGKGLGALGSLVHSAFLPSQEDTTATTENKITSVAMSAMEENSIHSVTETKEQDSIVSNITVVDPAQESQEIQEIQEINSVLEKIETILKDFEEKTNAKLSSFEDRIQELETGFVKKDSDHKHSNVCRDCHSSSTILSEIPTKEINTAEDPAIDSHHSHTSSGSSVKDESAIDT